MRDYGTTNAAPYASAPAVGLAGDTYFNTADGSQYVSNGTAWVKVGPSGAGVWTDTGTVLTPTDATRTVAAGTANDAFSWGVLATQKARLTSGSGGGFQWSLNASWAGIPDDITKTQWKIDINPNNDAFLVQRSPAGASTVYASMLSLDGMGKLTLPGPTAVQTESASLMFGSRTAKARLIEDVANNFLRFTLNHRLNLVGAAWAQDDTAKPSWAVQMFGESGAQDQFNVARCAPGGAFPAALLTVDNIGRVTIPGSASGVADYSQLLLGTASATSRICAEPGGRLDLLYNGYLGTAWATTDTTKPSWLLGIGTDSLGVWRAPPTSGAPAWQSFFSIDATGKTNCTLADGIVTRSMMTTGHGVWHIATAGAIASFNANTSGVWWKVAETTVNVRASGCVVILLGSVGLRWVGAAAGSTVILAWFRDGTATLLSGGASWDVSSPAAGFNVFTLPMTCTYDNTAPAGNHTYGLYVYLYNTNGTVQTRADWQGNITGISFA